MNITAFALEQLGVVFGLAMKYAPLLEQALGLILDEGQRRAEFAVALAEMRANKVPTIVLKLIGELA